MTLQSLMRTGPYRILGGNRSLSLLLVGQAFSSLADWLLAVVLTVLVYDISHSGTTVVLLHQPHLALLVTAGAFMLSGAAFYSARMPARSAAEGSMAELSLPEILAGFRFVLRENERVLVGLTVTAAGLALLAGGYYALAVVLSTQAFHFGGQGVGWLDAVYGVGNLGGSLAVGVL